MDLHPMPDRDADASRSAADLRRVEQLDRDARRASRWYIRFLVAFALASFVMAALFGVIGGIWVAAVVTSLWVVFVAALSVWSARQRTRVRGMTRLHLRMMLGWTMAWGLTVIVGAVTFPDTLWWWVLGGVAMATPPLLSARRVEQRTRP